ncbi:tetratricopeptide (TPR) repeat protein [Rhodanobacter sp. A1T4]|nr:tetratricopeptide (TPR) repeat protein [Rhodanobacter sp. A1T4]
MDPRLQGLSPDALKYLMAAGEALDSGRRDRAAQQLEFASAIYPDHPEVLRMHSGLLSLRNLHSDAIKTMQRAIRQRPQDALYHNTMGTLLGAAGDYELATKALQHACDLQPSMAFAWYNLGVMLTRCVRNDEAISALQRAVSLAPDHWNARALLADMLRTHGRIEEAESEYRSLLRERPTTGTAWWGLADLRTTRFKAEDIQQMQVAAQDPHASIDDLIAIRFALAKALEDSSRYADSLAVLADANAMARSRQEWDASAFSHSVAVINAAFSPPPASADAAIGQEVIFVTSLPRSGSTLVEQILASHSSVEGAGELPDLPLVLNEESRRRDMPFPQWVSAMQPADWERLGRRYLERTARWRKHRPVFTDKLLNNWMYIGAIRAMLPSARIIVCRRDPLETCFSCYRQHLANNEYTRTFDDLASFWQDFDRNVHDAIGTHSSHVFDHQYEILLADPEAQVRRLLDFCDLPFEPDCVNFHETKREVRSPSATQVRQPLHDTSRAMRYGALLDPLRSALDMPLWQ